ncbi:dephospho-CoA kinase [Allorhodopirellula solitaria]|uniref:Dephospho-CoA kinase n=1 Tax=Allorhodopirellula solitaria TaxID=2527987 RepID=A0A5C5XXC5_9BACT|nr:dephospho-CoA kinase [Allorhodopirellula solitaria]TWT67348.1 Dephospho-CoA kinase [Allorhodopirellula solitaria]
MTESPKTIVIGVIGPPCSGKSTVARIIESNGGVWIDADAIAKDQLTDPAVIDELVEHLGSGILSAEGAISRPDLADLVFGDDGESQGRLKQLESVIHPRTHAVIQSQIQQAAAERVPFVILDVPLLLESGWESQCDQVWCLQVSADRHEQLLAARGWDAAELARRERRQLSWSEKRRRSSWVIQNNGDVNDLREQIVDMLSQLQPESNSRHS